MPSLGGGQRSTKGNGMEGHKTSFPPSTPLYGQVSSGELWHLRFPFQFSEDINTELRPYSEEVGDKWLVGCHTDAVSFLIIIDSVIISFVIVILLVRGLAHKDVEMYLLSVNACGGSES